MLKKLFNQAFPKQYFCIICDKSYRTSRNVLTVVWSQPPTTVCAWDLNCWKVFAAAVEFGWVDVYIDPKELTQS